LKVVNEKLLLVSIIDIFFLILLSLHLVS